MYAREIEEETLTFGVSGKLIMNALVMYDHQTRSLWSQFLGQSVRGEYTGTKLEFVPALLTDWATWAELHPDTMALDVVGKELVIKAPRGELGSFDPYTDYYASGSAGVLGETVRDDRLSTKEFVIGLEGDGEATAYPYRLLNDTPVINDTFQGAPIVVVLDTESGTGTVFDRRVDGQTLTFDAAEDPGGGPLALVDQETGSRWEALTGEAVEGPLEGAALEPFRSLLTYWFAWKDYYPQTAVHGQG